MVNRSTQLNLELFNGAMEVSPAPDDRQSSTTPRRPSIL
jgi:hypothetical protein